jgi:FKBP-type peptidyl-prolyl cis-trans isomerase 2
MAQAKNGDTVKVHYTGKFADGTVFDSSEQGDALQFTLGEGQLIPGFEKAVLGMDVGETKTFTIPATEAYGAHNADLVFTVDRSSLPSHINPAVGQRFQIRQRDGSVTAVTVSAVSDAGVTFDANHPLAGKDLTFDIQIIEIA